MLLLFVCLTNGAYWAKAQRLLKFCLYNLHSVSFLELSFIANSGLFFSSSILALLLWHLTYQPKWRLNDVQWRFFWRSMTFFDGRWHFTTCRISYQLTKVSGCFRRETATRFTERPLFRPPRGRRRHGGLQKRAVAETVLLL